MHIVGIGTDIVEVVRVAHMIDRHGEMFLTRVFTAGEIRYCRARRKSNEHFAARFAAKEAVLKCLGTGMAKGLSWTEIEVCNETRGQPSIKVHGATRDLAQNKRVREFLISLSHCRNYATAFATAVSDDV
jgi:holo-[acyl-carrier protein] synthase